MSVKVTAKRGRISTDVTDDIQMLFDALIGSMDWGSGFLSTEEVCAIIHLGRVCGFDVPDLYPYSHNLRTYAELLEALGEEGADEMRRKAAEAEAAKELTRIQAVEKQHKKDRQMIRGGPLNGQTFEVAGNRIYLQVGSQTVLAYERTEDSPWACVVEDWPNGYTPQVVDDPAH